MRHGTAVVSCSMPVGHGAGRAEAREEPPPPAATAALTPQGLPCHGASAAGCRAGGPGLYARRCRCVHGLLHAVGQERRAVEAKEQAARLELCWCAHQCSACGVREGGSTRCTHACLNLRLHRSTPPRCAGYRQGIVPLPAPPATRSVTDFRKPGGSDTQMFQDALAWAHAQPVDPAGAALQGGRGARRW